VTLLSAAEKVEYVPATGTFSALWLLLALPAAGAAILLLSGKRAQKWGPLLACAMTGSAFVWGLISFFALKGEEHRQVSQHLFSWVPVGSFQVDAGLLFDPLSATFVLLITGVGFLIHVYSLGYMEHDDRKVTFFAYLNLFVAAMLLLVLGNSFLALYVGWEGVGLASYLLIACCDF
jgi:NADH-quinone oxidoreductase subunit L